MIPKHRAWHKQRKIMLPVLEINLDPEHGGVFVEGKDGHYCDCRLYMELWHWSNIELMQFTGLQDCTGKDIYEGDLVHTNNDEEENEQEESEPEEDHYHGVVTYNPEKAWYYIKQPDSSYTPTLCNTTIVSIEVIGNIYENSNLLPQEQQS